MNKKLKCVMTGGHHNSALVVARELLARGYEVEWIGHRYAAKGDNHDSAEYIEVTAAHIPFHELKAGKSELSLDNVFNIPLGVYRAVRMIQHIRPDCVISFGGYLGFAVALASYMQKIPVYIHEQTSIAGKANKLTACFARLVFVTWESSLRYFPSAATRVVGLPVRDSFVHPVKHKLFTRRVPTIFVLCGKQGSHIINKLICAHLHELVTHYNVIHQTGTSSATGDYDKAIALKESLPKDLAPYYEPYGYIAEDTTAAYIANCDVVVGRSGAHTTYHLGLIGKKCVLIPLMSTHGHEQLHLARILERAGIAVIVPQSELSYPSLLKKIRSVMASPDPQPLDVPVDAARVIVDDIVRDMSKK